MPYIGNPIYQSAFVTDQFSGNGSTTAFTMSVAPAGTSNVLVVVSGVVQDPATYGVVGTTLNFTTAPPSGTGNISCRYLGVPVTGVATTAYRTVTEFTATASQTTFTPPSYTVGYINVYRNGVRLGSADYTASNGTTVVLATGASAGDLITTESFLVSTVLNAVPQSGGTISGNLVVTGTETVGGGTPLGGATNPVVASTGNANNYIQSYIYNTNSAGANASADFTAYPSNGADSAGWVDMGITGPNFSQAAYSVTGPNEAYLFGSAPSGSGKTGNLVLATDSTGTANAIQFYTGGFTQAKSAARMTIDGSGNVGVGSAAPSFTHGPQLYVYNGTEPCIGMSNSTMGTTNFATIRAYGADFYIDNASTGNILFRNGSGYSERMRIDASGNVFVGGTSQSTATAPVYSKTTAKAIVMWTTISSTVTTYSTFNVSSVTRNSQGNFTVTLTTAMSNNSFACVSSANSGGSSGLGSTPTYGDRQSSAVPTSTTTVSVINGQTNSAGGLNDATFNSLVVFGT